MSVTSSASGSYPMTTRMLSKCCHLRTPLARRSDTLREGFRRLLVDPTEDIRDGGGGRCSALSPIALGATQGVPRGSDHLGGTAPLCDAGSTPGYSISLLYTYECPASKIFSIGPRDDRAATSGQHGLPPLVHEQRGHPLMRYSADCVVCR